MKPERLYQRFLSKVAPDANGCQIWQGQVSTRGYGRFCGIGAHRWILGYLRGEPLAATEFALHRCDTPLCVNPHHLYVGDHQQNMQDMVDRRRGRNVLAQANATKTHCPRGHEYTPENTRHNGRGSRECRACIQIRHAMKKQTANAA